MQSAGTPPSSNAAIGPRASTVTAAAAQPAGGPVIESAALLQGGKSVTICHHGELYRLQATRQGKLILTK